MLDAPALPAQKEIERWQLERFAELSQSLPPGEPIECEGPDFLFQRDGDVLGIEITELYWEHQPGTTPHQLVESLRSRIASLAGRRYAARGLPPLHASIHVNPSYVPSKRDVPRLSDQIADLLSARVPEEGGAYREDYDWVNRAYFPEEVHHISALRVPNLDRSFFTSPGAAFIPPMTREDIERALALKAPKLDNYRLKCHEVWLVIFCDGAGLATTFDHSPAATDVRFITNFDRAFLLRHMAGEVNELQLSHAGP